MKVYEEYLPKYWIGHDKKGSDVFIDTASKSYHETLKKMELKFGDKTYSDPNLVVDLFSINYSLPREVITQELPNNE